MTQHRRDSEDEEYRHAREGDGRKIPEWLYWVMTFINRMGFPIVVCVYLFYSQNTTMHELKVSMDLIAKTIQTMAEAVDKNTTAIDEFKRSLRVKARDY